VAEAEQLAGADPERIPWKTSGDRLRVLFDEWRRLQRDSRLDKHTEDDLWKRFSHARTTFDRKRRHYFGALDEERNAAKHLKEDLVKQAEELSTSTDWSATAVAYRDLMNRWKEAGRAAKRDDDALWTRFRAAQDAFFAARQAANSQVDAEFSENLAQKEALLVEAEALLPVRDLGAAKAGLRDLQARWDAIGKVPRTEMARIEARLRKVEQTIRDYEQDRWKRSNPEARARASDLVAQLEKTIAGLETDLAKAEAAGNQRRIKDTEQSLTARREWLEQAQRALEEFTG
jgi:capsule polysaccharide export protein KpsE/RkpR